VRRSIRGQGRGGLRAGRGERGERPERGGEFRRGEWGRGRAIGKREWGRSSWRGREGGRVLEEGERVGGRGGRSAESDVWQFIQTKVTIHG